MITKDDIKCELFESVEIADGNVEIYLNKNFRDDSGEYSGLIVIDACGEFCCGETSFSKEQFDEIIRVRQLLMETAK